MPVLFSAILVVLAAAVAAVVYFQATANLNADLQYVGDRYAADGRAWASQAAFPPVLTRLYISAVLRESDSRLLSSLGYAVTAERVIPYPRGPKMWVVTWTKTAP